MTDELIKLTLGTLLGIALSIPVSLALLLALSKRDTVTEYVRVVQGEVVEDYRQLGEGK